MLWGEVVEYWAPLAAGQAVALRFEDRELHVGRARPAHRASWPPAWPAWASATATGSASCCNNRPEFVETAMACMKLGAIGVPVNVRFTPPELAYVITNADCAVIVTEDAWPPGWPGRGRAARACRSSNADDGTLDEARERRRPAAGGGDRPGRPAVHLLHERHDRRPEGRGAHPRAAGTTPDVPGAAGRHQPRATASCCRSRWPSPVAWPC